MTTDAKTVVDFQGAPLNEFQRHLDADRTIDSNPLHTIQSFFVNPEGNLTGGVWESTPGKWEAFTDRDEFCYLIEGHVVLTNKDGHAQTL